jgi:hypothetical protein
MSFIYIPVVEIMHLLMRIRRYRPFMRISRLLMLSLVVLSAISYQGEWAKAPDPTSPPCLQGKWECYEGTPLSFTQYVFQLDASERLLLLPLMDVLAALLLLFKPRRTYLTLLLLGLISIVVNLTSDPIPYVDFLTGSGYRLHLITITFFFFLTLPLALDEQMKLYPNWDYRKFLPGSLID